MADCPDCGADERRQDFLSPAQQDAIEAAGTRPEADWFRCVCGAVLAFRDRAVVKVGALGADGWRPS